MNQFVGGNVRQQKIGGLSAVYLALAYVVAMPYFLLLVKYQSVVDPVKKVALLVANQGSMRIMYLLTYVILGIVLAVLALALHSRLKDGAPVLAQAATAVGLMWAIVLIASGMIFNAGAASVVGLHSASPAQAVAAWQAIEPVAQGLGGSGGELLGGLWVLLISVAALRTRRLPKVLSWLGVAIGAAGVISVVPALNDLAYAFGVVADRVVRMAGHRHVAHNLIAARDRGLAFVAHSRRGRLRSRPQQAPKHARPPGRGGGAALGPHPRRPDRTLFIALAPRQISGSRLPRASCFAEADSLLLAHVLEPLA